MGKRRKRPSVTLDSVKRYQALANKYSTVLKDWVLEEDYLNSRKAVVNRRRWSRIGYVDKAGKIE